MNPPQSADAVLNGEQLELLPVLRHEPRGLNRLQFVASLVAAAAVAAIPAPVSASAPAKVLAYTGELRMWSFSGCPRVIAPTAAEAVALAVREGYDVLGDTPRLVPPDEHFTIYWNDGPPEGFLDDSLDERCGCECSEDDLARWGCECDASTARTTLSAAGWADEAANGRGIIVIGEYDP